jgi:hypothetical protein
MKQVIGLSVFVILTATIVIPVAAQAELKPQVGRPTPNDMAKNTATLNNNTFSVPTSVVSDKSNRRITRSTLPATMRGQAARVAAPAKQETSWAARNTATLNNNTFSVPTSVVSDKSNRITRTTLPATIRGHAVRVATPTKQEASRAAPIMPRTLRMPAQASRQLSKHF